MIAVSRLFMDNFDNIQVPWGKLGLKMSQLTLLGGGNDLAGTMFSDDISVKCRCICCRLPRSCGNGTNSFRPWKNPERADNSV
jgi:hypothetical protein